ncbi:molybdopterin-dependent oxidoreductase [Sphingobium sp. V4]|uniref:molybdopterin-containing oxidoreductase family protein n=1 Tax=Sphingobium sp. V4 TaxID=3038927 RepID=UPI0025581AF5|nr:molybdopterin-dependent oxidoreductase [Sphingobium sp. V4]WIW89469.1 molybdopterin-dependent oxidoreductase [Sphingobium sp. V4]
MVDIQSKHRTSRGRPDGIYPGLCRLCVGYCPIMVTVENGRAVKVAGDPDAPLFDGYTCPKGRALPDLHYGPQRLLQCLRRHVDRGFVPVPSAAVVEEISDRVRSIIDRHGPQAIAVYYGTGSTSSSLPLTVAKAWLDALGSTMFFSVNTIDKPGMQIAQARHGLWEAGHPSFEDAEAWILVGSNPIISKTGGFPQNNPGMRLKEAVNRGLKLIVIDPRRSEVARRAHIHLQCLPGNDPAVLAAIVHVIIAERLFDADFVDANADGLEALESAVASFKPAAVAARAGVEEADLIEAAHVLARARSSGIFCGTGPSFATYGTLTEYLANCLTTLCGHWARAGDVLQKPNVLLPAWSARAQPIAPYPEASGAQLRVRGLRGNASGLPVAALADEILLEGEGQIKALFCLGGNPMMAFPDQRRTHEALRKLDLLVVLDPEMNATARLADYVLPPSLILETPGTSLLMEAIKYNAHSRGLDQPYARYAPAIVDPPAGSDLMGDWEFFYELAKHMGLPLTIHSHYGIGPHREAPCHSVELDMTDRPSTDELIELLLQTSRIPLAEVKNYPHGHIFAEVKERVRERDPACMARLDLGNSTMMGELEQIAVESSGGVDAEDYPLLLVPRRVNHLVNSYGRASPSLNSKKPYNPLSINPADASRFAISSGDQVLVQSRFGEVRAIVEEDKEIRPGVVSMSHCFGGNPGDDEDPSTEGANVGRLISVEDRPDPITGIPRMGALPIRIVSL